MPNESYKQKEVTLRSSPGPEKGVGTDTVPDLALPARLGVSTDTLPEQAGVYVPPRPLASASDHRTIEIAPVRLAREIDPRRAPTELRLSPPPPPKQARSLVLVLSALLIVAVGGFFAARYAVTPSEPLVVSPPMPVPTSVVQVPPVARTAESAVVVPALPAAPTAAPQAEPELVPVTPAELDAASKPAPARPPPRDSAEPKKKVREPWLE